MNRAKEKAVNSAMDLDSLNNLCCHRSVTGLRFMLRIYSPEDRIPVAGVRDTCLRIRAAKRWTQGQLAKHARVPRKAIERIEQQAVQTVDKSVAERIAKLEAA